MSTDRYEEYRDKRKYFRHPVALLAEIRRDESDSYEACHIINVSVEGLELYSQSSFNEGEKMSVKIPFGDSFFACMARVAWERASDVRCDLGLEFLCVDRITADEMIIKGKRGNKEVWGRAS